MRNLMQVVPKCLLIYKQPFSRNIYKRCYSTEQAVKIQEDKGGNAELFKDFEKISAIYTRKTTKKPQKPPFLKNVFLGKYDADMLTYPELEKEDLARLNESLEPTESYFNNLAPLQKPPSLKSDFMENLKRLKLFGLQGSQVLGARELTAVESCRFNEVLSSQSSAMMGLLCNDTLVFQALLKYGTEEQKNKYLPGLISGNTIGAFCVTEPIIAKESIFKTSAKLTKDKKGWILNGEKSSIVNGEIANILLVLSKTEFLNREGMTSSKLTLFIVEKNFPGITTEPCNPTGLHATDFANLKFNNTPIPAENILGKVNEAEDMLPSVLTEFRLGTSSACSRILRQLINETVKYCTQLNIEKRSLAETEYVQSLVAKLTVQLYAIESTIYLSASLMDQYENQDCQMEAIALKILSSQQTCCSVVSVMEMLGPAAYMNDHWCNVLYKDALSHLILHEPSENLKCTLSLLGLQHTGINIQEKVKKIRNPLFYPAEALKRIWSTHKQMEDNPRLTLNLAENLHPSLIHPAEWLEYSVLRFEYAVECILVRLGNEVVNSHMDLKRLAECIIDIYVMTACLGRASRAYCIGLRHAEMEVAIAHAICLSAVERVRGTLNHICGGPYSTNDDNYKKIADNLFKVGEYFPVHPLTRNF